MSTVVTGHRMAFAFSSTRTVLWDQIEYSGSPADSRGCSPVQGRREIEAAEDAWFEALEAVTNRRHPAAARLLQPEKWRRCACGGASSDSAAGFRERAPPP